jgi:hypothetical protein
MFFARVFPNLVALGSTRFMGRRKKSTFKTIRCGALLQRPPTPPPPTISKHSGDHCFKAKHQVFAAEHGRLSPPYVLGELIVYASELSMIDAKVDRAKTVVKDMERGRKNRVVMLGERTLYAVGGQKAKECTGAYFDMHSGETKKLF